MSNAQRLRPTRYRCGDYIAPLLDAHAAGHFRPGTLTVAQVRHDADCRRPDGGPCTCRPNVELVITPVAEETGYTQQNVSKVLATTSSNTTSCIAAQPPPDRRSKRVKIPHEDYDAIVRWRLIRARPGENPFSAFYGNPEGDE